MAGEHRVENKTNNYGFRPRKTNNYRKRNGRHGPGQTQIGKKPNGSNGLNKVIEDIGKTLASLSKRLENVENRGPDRQPERLKEAGKPKAGPLITQRSNNDEFAVVSKSIYRMVQIQHHQSNWQQLPKSIDDRLSKLANDIKPPMADKYLRSTIDAATKSFGETITNIVRQHLERKRLELETAAIQMNPVDVDQARTVADKYLTNRLGKRLDADSRSKMLDEAVSKIGSTTRQQSKTASVDMDADGYQTVRKSTSGRKPQQSRKPDQLVDRSKRKAECSPTTAALNRYQVLADIERIEVLDTDVEESDENEQPSPTRVTKPTPKKLKTIECPRTPAGVHVYTGDKTKWMIEPKPETKILIVGDSNMRDAPRVPAEWEIHSLPGAKLNHVTSMLRRMKQQLPKDTNLKHVIIQVGINHRSSLTSKYEYDLGEISDEISDIGVSSSYCGIAVDCRRLPENEVEKINEINNYVKTVWMNSYIDPLPETEIRIQESDVFGIHYTRETIGKIVNRMVDHINSLSVF
jgi:hypothetical protein